MTACPSPDRTPGVCPPALPDPLPDAILEQAALWHARLREPGHDRARRAAFARWLAADARHPAAFAEISGLWDALATPTAQVLAEERRLCPSWTRRPARRFPRPALAAAACLLLLMAALWQGGMVDRLRADHAAAIGERRAITLADGSTVLLNSGGLLSVDLKADQRTARLLRGEAWFSVTAAPERPFTVETAFGSVRVVGTRFNVRLTADSAEVSLFEGKVLATPKAGSGPVSLTPGQQVVLRQHGTEPAHGFDAGVVGGWRHGQMVFYATPLEAVVAELNRYHRGRILLLNDTLAHQPVSGVFDTADPDGALEIIRRTLAAKVHRLSPYLVVVR